ncbi:MAG TPA: nucleoside recognition domain-containing protein, partial [Clostridia bacterium]|nr:nucleoside recognition domain-containing protein [Clostridia bacterium]
SSIFIWFTSSFGIIEGKFTMVEDLSDGFLSKIGTALAWIFKPLGFGEWRLTVATIMGLVAKENVVSTIGILYGFAEVSESGEEIWELLAASYTQIAAYSYLAFNLLCAPCFAAIGATKREMNSGKWTWFAVGYQTVFAYAVALIIYQIGTLISTGAFGLWTVIAFIVLGLMLYLLFRPQPKRSLTGERITA